MKRRRRTRGIPNSTVTFGAPDPSPFAPLHRRLGIQTYVHRQAVTDYHGGFDQHEGTWWSPHLYRAEVTLPRV